MKINNEHIIERLSGLLNKKLSAIGRAGSMLWLGFGELVPMKNFREEIRNVYEYALHVSCSWRLTDGKKIIVASRDMYFPKMGMSDENFDWDVLGNNRFDERVNILGQEIKNNVINVDDLIVDKYGGLSVRFNNGHELDVFPDDSFEEEYWRFISYVNGSEHLVVFQEE